MYDKILHKLEFNEQKKEDSLKETKKEKTMKFKDSLLAAFKKVAEAKDKDPKDIKELSKAMEEMKLVE